MRTSRPLKIAIVLLALVAGTLLVLRHYARPERVAALLAEQTRARLGLDLAFTTPARYSLFPRLRLELDDARFALPGENEPLLALERLDVSLPWSSLFDSRLIIEELQLTRPKLELLAAQRWIDLGDDTAAAPDLRLHLRVEDATLLRDGKAIARDIDFSGDVDTQQLQQWWREFALALPHASALPPLPGAAQIGAIELDGVRLDGIRIESAPTQ
jgi:hypothetical protein